VTNGFVLASYIAGYGLVAGYVIMVWRRLARARRDRGDAAS